MTPEPAARPSSRGARRRKKRSNSSGPKNSRKRSSISGDGAPSCAASGFTFTLTLTTDGVARSATDTNASSSARRSAFESGAGAAGAGRDWATAAGRPGSRSAASRSTGESRPRRIVISGLRASSYRRARGGTSRLERELEDTRRGGGDRRALAAADARHPHDVTGGLDE